VINLPVRIGGLPPMFYSLPNLIVLKYRILAVTPDE